MRYLLSSKEVDAASMLECLAWTLLTV